MRTQTFAPSVNITSITAIANQVSMMQPHQPLTLFTTNPTMSTTSSPSFQNTSAPSPTTSTSNSTASSASSTPTDTSTAFFASPQPGGRGRKKHSKNWTDPHVTILLSIIAQVLPRGGEEWETVLSEYIRATKDVRDVTSIKDKWNKLRLSEKATGNPTMIQHVRDAKHIDIEIDKKGNVITLGSDVDTDALHDLDVEHVDMWGDTQHNTSIKRKASATYTTATTATSKRKRKLEDAVYSLVDHLTGGVHPKTANAATDDTSIHTVIASMSQQLQQQQAAQQQFMVDMLAQQQNIVAQMQLLQKRQDDQQQHIVK